jgi:CRP-like cAMP-binding protein
MSIEASTLIQPAEDNQLLASLPLEVVRRLTPHFEIVPLVKGRSLYEMGDRVTHAIFPTSGLISLNGATADGGTVEIVSVANDGLLGLPLHALGDAPHSARVLVAGRAIRIPSRVLITECQRQEALQRLVLNWAHRLLCETSQAVVCHRFHRLLERLCRWLLTATDRLHTDRLALTHEELAHALGSPRTVVTTAAVALQDAGAIKYRHGRITILNRRRLELSACECYGALRIPPPPSSTDVTH